MFRASRTVYTIAFAFVLSVVFFLSAASAAVVAQPGITVIRYGNDNWAQTHLPEYGTIFMGYRLADLAYVKDRSPATRVLFYKDPIVLSSKCGNPATSACTSPVSYAEALEHDNANPGDPWMLRDLTGQPIHSRFYASDYYANIASASFRKRVVSNLLAAIKNTRFDGFFFDEIGPLYYNYLGNPVYANAPSPTFPDNASFQRAIQGFMDYVGPSIRSQGLYVGINGAVSAGSDGIQTTAWWEAVGKDVDGLSVEFFEMDGNGKTLRANPDYTNQLKIVDAAQNQGKDFYAGMSGSASETAKMMYGKAAFLLKWNGRGGGFYWHLSTSDPWNPAWTTDIGTPSGAMYAVGGGWRRNYSAGTVIVNPSAASAQTFNLGASYTTPAGQTVTTVTLQPTTAMILTGSATAPPPPPPPSGYSKAIAKHSGKCLDVASSSTADGAKVQQWSCTGGNNQRWKLVSMGDGYNKLVAAHSGKCLDVAGSSTADGAKVQQWSCTGGNNQRWKLVSMGDGYNELVAKHSGKCLDVNASSTADAANVQQWSCHGGNNQRWMLVAID